MNRLIISCALAISAVSTFSVTANLTSTTAHPLHWYVGMASSELQLMVHNAELPHPLAQYSVALSQGSGVELTHIHSYDNPNYVWLDLNLNKSAPAQTLTFEFTHASGTQFTLPYTLEARRAGSASREGFSPRDVIYLIAPDRFKNGDTSNDATPDMLEQPDPNDKIGRHGGDIQGMIDSIDYFEKMGFTQIWTMPLLENNMARATYHGYSTTDYYRIDPRFGSNALYREFSLQAKSKGVGTIKDVVLNHIGSAHPWMDDMPTRDWINHGTKFVPTTHMRETLHDPNATDEDRIAFTDGWFVPTMPDLNQRNPLVATYLTQMATWWIEYADLSGLRVDTYSYSDKDFLSQWTRDIMAEYPNLNIVGEEWAVNPVITSYWQRGSKRHDDYQTALPSVMDFPLQVALSAALTEPENWNTGLKKLYDVLAQDFLYGDPSVLVVFGDNHDMQRILPQLNNNPELLKMALTFLSTVRGTPQLFYGTEIAETGGGTGDHGLLRSQFPGGFAWHERNAFTGKGLSAAERDMQAFTQALLQWRKQSLAVTSGKMIHYTPKDGVYVYFRQANDGSNPGEHVMVVINKNDTAVEIDTTRYKTQLIGRSLAKNVLSGQSMTIENLMVEAKSATIFELQ